MGGPEPERVVAVRSLNARLPIQLSIEAIDCSGGGETMAELAVPAVLEPEQAGQHYADALQTAVAACAADTAGQACFICMDGSDEEGLVRGCACRGGSSFAHVSCLAEQAKILFAEAKENNLGENAVIERWARWYTCGLCKQEYHGVVRCALGWACWKTYVGPGRARCSDLISAMRLLGLGLMEAKRHDEALSVTEAELAILRRIGAPEDQMLMVQSNLAMTYKQIGRLEEALNLYRDVYCGELKLYGAEHSETLASAVNYATSLVDLQRVKEAKSLLRRTVPALRRVLGESHNKTLMTRWLYAMALYEDGSATLDDLRDAVTTLEEIEPTARSLLGDAHPSTASIKESLRDARAALRACRAPRPRDAVAGSQRELPNIVARE